uniref:Forkhead box protein pes-1 n=1 Tax=Caenorhabditis japonica TaxID=281687 RepID=A0A8R1EJ28_CAEJA
MSELNSSLCQLNWLIAKGGIGAEPIKEPVEENCAPVQEGQLVQSQPLQITIPTPKQVPHPQKSHDKKRRKVFDGPDKPPYSYSQLIRFAIEETEEKKCTLSEIYAYIAHNFQFYRENRNTSWKNSIRHNLSLNKQFSRIERTDGDRRGWWVCVDPPEKKPRVLKGSPVRVNPIYEEFYRKTKREEEEEEVVLLEQSTMYGETYITELTGDIRELTVRFLFFSFIKCGLSHGALDHAKCKRALSHFSAVS